MNIIYKQDMLEKTITALINKLNNKYPQFLNDIYNHIEKCASEGNTSISFIDQRTNQGYVIKFNNDITHLIESNYYFDWQRLLIYTGFTISCPDQTLTTISWNN